MKKLLVVAALAVVTCASQAFSLLGPWADWQIIHLGYQLNTDNLFPRDPGGPMGLREGYRWNLPVVTYAFDKSFMDVYGEKGMEEVERAFATINDTFEKMYTSENYLETVPTLVTRHNYRAVSLGIMDLYSTTLSVLCEKMGLASPDRFCWTLRDGLEPKRPAADASGNTVPTIFYTIRRNFDPMELETTPYVNGTLYSYRIIPGIATTSSGLVVDDAMEIVPDPAAISYTAVAGMSGNLMQGNSISGLYYSGLSRDDVGGLRWLYSANNYAFESTTVGGGGSAAIMAPQYDNPVVVTNIDLAQFLIDVEKTTNTEAQVQALYPGLNITDRTWTNTLVLRTNYVYTNSPWLPYGEAPVLVPVVTKNIQILYTYAYDNVYTNYGGTMTQDTIKVITVSSGAQSGNPWMPYGTTAIVTNVIEKKTNRVTGGIIILSGATGTNDTNATAVQGQIGGYQFIYTNPYPVKVSATNLLYMAGDTAAAGGTNATTDPGTGTGTDTGTGTGTDIGTGTGTDETGTNTVTYFAQYLSSSYLSYEYLAYPITWGEGATGDGETAATNGPVLYRPGLGSNFRFQRVNFDNLVGNTFTTTNMYLSNVVYMKMKDNQFDPVTDPYGQLESTVIRRQLSWPDFVISAGDLGVDAGGPVSAGVGTNAWINHSADNRATQSGSVAGPGIILGGGDGIRFSTVNEYWVNDRTGPLSLFEQDNGRYWVWGTFDGTTNEPVIYPINAGITIRWLEEQMTNSLPQN